MKSLVLVLIFAIGVSLIPSKTIVYVSEPPSFKVVTAEVSAYTSSKDETDHDPFTTASGSKTGPGIIACPAHLEFGTKVEIEGKVYRCEDRMNKRYRHREIYDIWVSSKKVAYEWGRKIVEVKIYE